MCAIVHDRVTLCILVYVNKYVSGRILEQNKEIFGVLERRSEVNNLATKE